VVSSGVCLVFATPNRPAKAVVDGVIIFVGEVE